MDRKFRLRPRQFEMPISLGNVQSAIEFKSLLFQRKVTTREVILEVISIQIKFTVMRQDEIIEGKNTDKTRGFKLQSTGEGASKGVVSEVGVKPGESGTKGIKKKIVSQKDVVHHEMPP